MNLNQVLNLTVAGAGVWYAVTGRSMALRIFVGVTAGVGLLGALPRSA